MFHFFFGRWLRWQKRRSLKSDHVGSSPTLPAKIRRWNLRSKLIRMSIRLLTGGQLVRFQSGALKFCEVVGKRIKPPDFQSGDRGFESRRPYHARVVHRIRILRYERREGGSIPLTGTNYEVVAERQRHLTVYEDQVGSTPIHFAKLIRRN